MKANFVGVADEVDKILNKKRESLVSVCMRLGILRGYNVLK